MRELTSSEICAVSGGVISPEKIYLIRASAGGPTPLGWLAISFGVGYEIGTVIYNTYTALRY